MTSKKSTKRALLLSVLSMILCLSMLIGTTFAWFTDSVTSGVNKIVAGNLDVELYHNATGAAEAVEDNKVNGETKLFQMALWEPGAVVYENFQIVNAGTLALKYVMNFGEVAKNYVVEQDGTETTRSLTDVLYVKILDGETAEGSRPAYIAEDGTKLGEFLTNNTRMAYGSLSAGASKAFSVVIYWPQTDKDNDYNLNNGKKASEGDALYIDMPISLHATQVPAENDSFGPDYDAAADGTDKWNAAVTSANAITKVESVTTEEGTAVAAATTIAVPVTPANDEGKTVTAVNFPQGVLEANATYNMNVDVDNNVADKTFVATNGAGAVASIDLNLSTSDTAVTQFDEAVTVTTYVSKGLTDVSVVYNGTGDAPTDVVYDAATGKLTFKTTHFSEYVVNATVTFFNPNNDTAYSSYSRAISAAADGDTLVCYKDAVVTRTIISGKTITLDLNGHTLTGTTISNEDVLLVKNATVTVKNGTLVAPAKVGASVLLVEGKSHVTVEKCTLKTNSNQSLVVTTNGANSLESTIEISDSTISAPTVAGKKGYALYAPAGDITFNNCDVTGHVFISGGNVTLDGGTYTATGFNNQAKIWHKDDTISYVSGTKAGTAFNMGDSILIADRRGTAPSYQIGTVTIKNITFNTEITLKDGTNATSYAIKYVDMDKNPGGNRATLIVENCTYNNPIDGKDPVMYVDLSGNDVNIG